jgi:hypothetical protein
MNSAAARRGGARRRFFVHSGGVALVFVLLAAGPLRAGPPYVTDDPEPTRTGGWENYLYLTGTQTPGTTAGQAGVELNYGAAANLQLSITMPADYMRSRGLRAGVGDIDVGAKFRFLDPPDDSWLPDTAVFPALSVPTGAHGFGAGHASLFLPIWLEKDFGPWSTFGGGGRTFNPGNGQRNYGLVGWAVTHSFGEALNIGVEFYHQTPTSTGGAASTNLGFGVVYQVLTHWALMASGGPGLENPSRSGSATFYVSLQFTD